MGVVCKYRNATLNKFAAVKMIISKDLSEAAMVRFQREGQAAAKLQHPGIVAVHDLGVTEFGDPYMIMDYYEGETLEELLDRKFQFSLAQLESIFSQCAEAMQHAHGQGVLHRDLKPSNIMVTNLRSDKQVIKILDFGIAKILDDNGEFTTTVGLNAGSPLYMSPEQSQGSPVDIRADIYSLGCVFYAALVGEPPFNGKNSLEISLQHQKEKPRPISQIPHLKACPPNVSNTIMQMLEKDPWNRPQTMKEVCNLLQKRPQTSRTNRKKKVIWIGVAITLLCIIMAVAFFSLNTAHIEGVRSSRRAEDSASPDRIREIVNKYPTIDPTKSQLFSLAQRNPTRIDVRNSDVADRDCSALLLAPNLQELSLVDNELTDAGVQIISQIPGLRTLNLEGNTRISDVGLKYISPSRTIRELNLRHTKINDEGMKDLARMTQLEKLHLDDTEVTDRGVNMLGDLKNLTNLQLNNDAITDGALQTISKTWPNLTVLKIGGGIISAKGLNALKNLTKLEQLGLAHCTNISKEEIRAVSRLRSLKMFESGENFNDSDTEILCRNPGWVELRLNGTVTGKTLQLLMTEKNLVKLKIVGSLEASPSIKEKFHNTLPNCKVALAPTELMVKAFSRDREAHKALTSP
jgi:serine/threonine protein kinase